MITSSFSAKLGQRGVLVIPIELRQRWGLDEGSLLLFEETERGLLLRVAEAVAIERYSAARRAEFLLNNAVDDAEYALIVEEVRAMGLDPDAIPHQRPAARGPQTRA